MTVNVRMTRESSPEPVCPFCGGTGVRMDNAETAGLTLCVWCINDRPTTNANAECGASPALASATSQQEAQGD